MLLQTGTTFHLGGEFADDPQVATALDDAAQVLGSLGLRHAEPAELTVSLTRAEMPAGSWRLQGAPDEGRMTVAAEGFCFSVARNRHVEGWQITGLPEGGAFFNARGYLPVA